LKKLSAKLEREHRHRESATKIRKILLRVADARACILQPFEGRILQITTRS
jgi:hypothetical protein